MDLLADLARANPVAHDILVLALVAIGGLALGLLRVGGVALGVAGVLFSGLLAGHLGLLVEHATLEFVREFGLILFVYTIGMQVGRGFFASLRAQGLSMNALAALVVASGGATAVGVGWLFGIDMPAALGVLSGATTNTPALGAVQQTLASMPGATAESLARPGLGYAVAYPGAIAGLIASMVVLRSLFRVDLEAEREARGRRQQEMAPPPQRISVRVENENLEGVALARIPGASSLGVAVARIRPAGQAEVVAPREDTVIHVGDVLSAVGHREALDGFRTIVGREIDEDLTQLPGDIVGRPVVVTHSDVLGRTLADLALRARFGVSVTRISRAGLEMPAGLATRLAFGDMLTIVGREEDVARAATVLGNSTHALDHTNMLAIFAGIAAGVVAGLYPIELPGLPVPLRLGLAGGPLVVAILISRLGHIGPVIWHMPPNANLALRELGLTLFLACVGLKSGGRFVETLAGGSGLAWVALGALVTLVPVFVAAAVGRWVMKLDFATLCGIIAGSHTDPPALAFATASVGDDSPNVAYATVYPLTMLLRILSAQLLTVLFCG